jgi:hypothetical protein
MSVLDQYLASTYVGSDVTTNNLAGSSTTAQAQQDIGWSASVFHTKTYHARGILLLEICSKDNNKVNGWPV